jgi:hypothetical protein
MILKLNDADVIDWWVKGDVSGQAYNVIYANFTIKKIQ